MAAAEVVECLVVVAGWEEEAAEVIEAYSAELVIVLVTPVVKVVATPFVVRDCVRISVTVVKVEA